MQHAITPCFACAHSLKTCENRLACAFRRRLRKSEIVRKSEASKERMLMKSLSRFTPRERRTGRNLRLRSQGLQRQNQTMSLVARPRIRDVGLLFRVFLIATQAGGAETLRCFLLPGISTDHFSIALRSASGVLSLKGVYSSTAHANVMSGSSWKRPEGVL